jgi:uncharacterized protein (TIGR02246 family)
MSPVISSATLAELASREEIRQLISRYCTAADTGRLDEVAGLFTVSGHIDFRGAQHVGADGIGAMFAESGRRLRGNMPPGRLLHTVSTTDISLLSDDTAKAISYFTVFSGLGADHWGRYRDELMVADGRWRFAARVITVDGRIPGGVGETLA